MATKSTTAITRARPTRRKAAPAADDCTIPLAVPPEALPRLKVRPDPEHERHHVRDYMTSQAADEPVVHLEKVANERVFGTRHDVWDVHTTKGRWWVLTNPTNLYSQQTFPSMDYVLSLHVGLMARVAARRQKEAPAGPGRDILVGPWRRWEQAVEALDQAEEAEDFQSVGMRCRECLLELARVAAHPDMLISGEAAPKKGDFMQWSGIIARAISPGSTGEEARSYLKASSKATWQLVNWLTHARNASRVHGQVSVDATYGVLSACSAFLVRAKTNVPDRCPNCSSYQIGVDYRPASRRGRQLRAYSVCSRCGWEALLRESE
jgi:predicted RNA-binding Zn-ribbon protein involved in translation (DUF1610 family)